MSKLDERKGLEMRIREKLEGQGPKHRKEQSYYEWPRVGIQLSRVWANKI